MDIINNFVDKCKEDFWYYPKWAMCYSLMILATYIWLSPYGEVY